MNRKILICCICAALAVSCGSGKGSGYVPEAASASTGITGIFQSDTEPTEGGVYQHVVLPPVPDTLSFAGEPVPLQYEDVYRSLERELVSMTYWHGSMIMSMQLASRYETYVKGLLEKNGVPVDFFYICLAESGLRPVVSPAGAAGYWQFLKGTAKQYGLIVEKDIDQRYDWAKSTAAAAEYFKKAYAEFGSWTLAAASYNIGIKNIRERIEYQSLNNYYDMQFPEETGRYVFRALAFKVMLSHPEKYGFHIDESRKYAPEEWIDVKVGGEVENWSEFAASYGTNFKMLKRYNEWMRLNGMKNRGHDTLIVRVPSSDRLRRQ